MGTPPLHLGPRREGLRSGGGRPGDFVDLPAVKRHTSGGDVF